MNMHFSFSSVCALLCAAFFFLLTACVDPITVGSDLLSDDRAILGFDDNVAIDLYTFAEDSVKVFDGDGRLKIVNTHFGRIEDEVFGRSDRAAYFFPELPRSTASGLIIRPPFLNTDTVAIDSIILVIPIDTNFFYADAIGQPFAYEAFEALEGIDISLDYYANSSFTTASMPIASGSVSPLKAATLLHDTMVVDSILTPHVRIRLDASLATRFLQADTAVFGSDEALRAFFAGVFLQPAAVTNALFAIRANSGFAGFYFYLSANNRNPTFYLMPMEAVIPSYRFDRTGSLAATLLNQNLSNQQALLEGQGGITAVVEVRDPESLRGKVINKAELSFYLDELPGYSYTDFPASSTVSLYFRNSNGVLQPIDDLTALGTSAGLEARRIFVGGELETEAESGRQRYRANLSVHLQRIINGDYDPTIYIRVDPAQQTTTAIFGNQDTGRSILRGPANAEFPMRLQITFTE